MTLQPNRENPQNGEQNPNDDILNYQEARQQPIHKMANYYAQADEAFDTKQSDGREHLQARYDADPTSLSAIELITLGSYHAHDRQEAKAQAKQARMKQQIADAERQQARYVNKSENGANMTLRDFL